MTIEEIEREMQENKEDWIRFTESTEGWEDGPVPVGERKRYSFDIPSRGCDNAKIQ